MVNTLRGIEALSDRSDEWIRRSITSTQMMIHSEEGGLYAANTGTEHGKKYDHYS